MARQVLAVLVVGLLLSLTAPASSEPGEAESSTTYVSRSHIRISDDSQFTSENGVTGGTGTAADPYRISGWHIIPPGDQGVTSDRAISIGGGVRTSHFVIEDNHIELRESVTKGISIGTPVGGTVRNNVIVATEVLTLGVVLAPGVNDRQDPLHPLTIEGNVFQGQLGKGQKGVGYSGTSAVIRGNQFMDLDVGVNVGGAYTTGAQFLRIEHNDFLNVDWGISALAFHGGTGSVPVVDARHNYYGHPEGPTFAMCSMFLGCHVGPLGERGAKVAPNVVVHPYADEPFIPDQ